MSFYRAYRFPWSAAPAAPPAVVASANDTGEETIVHASWNGATGVASWRVLAGAAPQALSARATIPSSGFESSVDAPATSTSTPPCRRWTAPAGRSARSAPSRVIGFYAALIAAGGKPGAASSSASTCGRVWSSSCSASSWSSPGSTSRSRSSICRRRPTARRCSPGRRRALAWRSVAFSSWAGLRSSASGTRAPTLATPASAPTPARRRAVTAEATAAPPCAPTRPDGRLPATAARAAARGVLRRAVHGDPRPEHRQRRAALDPVGPRILLARTAVGGRRLHDHVRGLPDARRPRRRPLRAAPHVRDRARAVRARLARGRARAGQGRARDRARAAGRSPAR